MEILGAGIASLSEVPKMTPSTLFLNLHMNRLRSTDGAQRFSHLKELILSANAISELRGLEEFGSLRVLDLSCNCLRRLSGLCGLSALEHLHVAYNHIETLEGLQELWGRRYALKTLDIRYNRVTALAQLVFVSGCITLEELTLKGDAEAADHHGNHRDSAGPIAPENAVCDEQGYRDFVAQAAPWLGALDGVGLEKVTDGPKVSVLASLEALPGMQPSASVSQLAELQAQLASAVQALEVPEAIPNPTVDRRLKELQEELAAAERTELATALEESPEVLACRSQEASRREARRRADLSAIATELQRREEQHRAVEAALAVANSELEANADAELHRAEAFGALAAEDELSAQLRIELAEQCELAAAEADEAASVRASLTREADQSCGFTSFAALRLELRRAEAAVASAEQSTHSCEEAVANLKEKAAALVTQVRKTESLLAEQQFFAQRAESEAYDFQRRVAEEAGAVAAIVSFNQNAEYRQRTLLSEKESSAARLTHGLQQLQVEIASAEFTQPRGLQEELALVQDLLLEEEQSSESALVSGTQCIQALRAKCGAALDQAEVQVGEAHSRHALAERALERNRLATRLAEDQQGLGHHVIAELRVELQQDEVLGRMEVHEAKVVLQEALVKEEAAADLEDEASREEELAVAVRRSLGVDFVPRSQAEELLTDCAALRVQISAIEQRLEVGRRDLERRKLVLSARRDEVRSLESQETKAEAQSRDAQMRLQIKEQMAADAREQMQDVQLKSRAASASHKEFAVELRDASEGLAESAGEWLQECAETEAQADRMEQEAGHLKDSATRSSEQACFAEQQLGQLRVAQAAREASVQAQVQQIRAQGLQVLGQARVAMAEMERRFREERAEQTRASAALRRELRDAGESLAEAPGELRAMQERMCADRRRSSERVIALLSGLRGG